MKDPLDDQVQNEPLSAGLIANLPQRKNVVDGSSGERNKINLLCVPGGTATTDSQHARKSIMSTGLNDESTGLRRTEGTSTALRLSKSGAEEGPTVMRITP